MWADQERASGLSVPDLAGLLAGLPLVPPEHAAPLRYAPGPAGLDGMAADGMAAAE